MIHLWGDTVRNRTGLLRLIGGNFERKFFKAEKSPTCLPISLGGRRDLLHLSFFFKG